MKSFIFGGNTGRTPEDIKRLRALVAAMDRQNRTPRNVGEGLTAIGNALSGRILEGRANRAEAAGLAGGNELFNMIAGGGTGTTAPASGAAPDSAISSTAEREAPPAGALAPPPSGAPASNLVMANAGATRNLPLVGGLQKKLSEALEAVFGPGARGEVYSGGQSAKGSGGKRTGSIRHDEGRAADLYVYGPDGEKITGEGLHPLAQYWAAKGYGGRGLEMRGGGIHLDDWATPPPGGSMYWNYGKSSPAQRAALASSEMPPLFNPADLNAGESMRIPQQPRLPVPAPRVPPQMPVPPQAPPVQTAQAPSAVPQTLPPDMAALAAAIPRPRPDIGPDIDLTRPVYPDAQGRPMTERSQTFQEGDQFFNRSSVGAPIQTGGPFNTADEALASAKLRSEVIGQARADPRLNPPAPVAPPAATGAPVDLQASATPRQAPNVPTGGQKGGLGIDPRLLKAMSDPRARWLQPWQQKVVASMIEQQMETNRPRTAEEAATLRNLQLRNQKLANPGRTTDMTPEEVAAAGFPPGSYQRGPLGKVSPVGGVQKTINIGAPPAGYGYNDPENPRAGMYVIPGGPVDLEMQADAAEREAEAAAAKEREGVKATTSAVKANVLTKNIAGIREVMKTSTLPTVGTNSRLHAWHTDSGAGIVRSRVAALKSGVAIQAMIRLKEASKTGATGFGQLNRSELQLLIDNMGSLDPDHTNEAVFIETLGRIEDSAKRVIDDIIRNVSPERIAELKLEPLLGMAGDDENIETMTTDELRRMRQQGGL